MVKRSIDISSEPMLEGGYNPGYFYSLAAIEDRHFWFQSRNRVIATLLSQIIATLPAEYHVLEVGCGTGNVLRVLDQVCTTGVVVGMDLFVEGLQFAKRRTNCALVQGDVHYPPFGKSFDLICCFDVLEHLPNDVQVLRDLHTMLSKDGVLFLTVPAHESLWSYFDEASHHCRRYEANELEDKLVGAGYQVTYVTQFMMGILPFVWLGRRLAPIRSRRKGGGAADADQLASDELRVLPVINGVLSRLLAVEARIVAGRNKLPFGTSLLAIARKSP